MEILVRFLNFLNVLFGKILSPLYSYCAKLPRKPLPAQNHPEILNSSATKLAEKIRTKQLTSVEVVKAFIERCQQVNGQLNAIIEDRFEAALEEAKNVDIFIQSHENPADLAESKPLLGVPITVKECLMVKGCSYTAGARLRKGIKAAEDGEAVANLRNAGAIPILVSNVPELCCSGETRSDIIGYTSNPYDPNRTSGGSSGGESALITSAASVLGFGSDFAGSIRNPSLFCGIFGHRPTSGIVSNEGHFPNSPADQGFQCINTIGPMGRYAEDLKLALGVLVGPKVADSLKLDRKVNVKDLKIYYKLDNGFKISEMSVNSNIKKAILKAADHFRSAHECSVFEIQIPEMNNAIEMCMAKVTQMKIAKKALCLKDPQDESSLLMEFVKSFMNKASYSMELLMTRLMVELSYFLISENKRPKYLSEINELTNRLKELLKEDGVLFYPTISTLAYFKQQTLWINNSITYSMIVNILGFPSTNIPMGLNEDGIPVGFQVIAAPNQDRLCLAVAEELEKAFGGWVPPPSS